MKLSKVNVAAALAFGLGTLAPGAFADGHNVHPGDILLISVWKEEGLEQEVLVRPDGGLSFPLVGDLQAQGKTVEEIRQAISTRIATYIPDPVVTVSARQILGNKIYVIGKVNNPGQFVVNPNVDIMQALSMAGGMNPFAAANNIKILRRVDDTQRAIPFNYGQI